MKKIKIYLIFIIMSFMMVQLSQAQMLGKWIIPTNNSSGTATGVYELTFTNSDITSSSLTWNTSFDVPSEFSAGAYNGNYDRRFYLVGDRLYFSGTSIHWNTNYSRQNEYQIIHKPGEANTYYSFFSENHPTSEHFYYNEIIYTPNTGQVDVYNKTTIRGGMRGAYIGFAILKKQEGDEYLYASTIETEPEIDNAGLRKWAITETGVINETVLLEEGEQNLDGDDFSAYNLELAMDESDNITIAWINGVNSEESERIIVVTDVDDDPEVHILAINEGAIGGIEFSSIEDHVLYASCTGEGIVKVDYSDFNNLNITTLTNSSHYDKTFLQTAPDGNIYGVKNDGSMLGRIVQVGSNAGNFEHENVFNFATNEYAATYREFSEAKYYILPENERVHSPILVVEEIVNETCPGYADGEATIYVSGGTPGYYPYPEYTIECFRIDNPTVPINEDYYDDYDDYFYFSELTAGEYIYTITDGIGGTADGEFTIEDTDFTHQDMYIITEENNDPWYNKSESFGAGIRVTEGITFTINTSVLEFGTEAKIIIEPGARLNVNNSILTSHFCEPVQKWEGVEVRGDRFDNQFEYFGHPLAQGKLVLTGSTIEHAIDAVFLAARNEEGRIDDNKTGGIIIANNSHFINNQKSVYGLYYQNMYPFILDYEYDNLSSFKNCTFNINSNYIFEDEDDDFHKHIDLTHVKGFNFEGCDLSNTASADVISQYNCGIMASDAGFTIDTYCSEPEIPCPGTESYFNGFYCAVWASSDGSTNNTFHISRANFTDNAIGVKASMIDNASILFSDFDIGYNNNSHAMAECGDRAISYGVDMLGCTGFAIEENDFTTTQTTGDYIGVRVKDCPSVSDDIYKNEFEGLSVANLAEGANRSVFENDGTGVSYICNHNSANDYDFHVSGISWIRGNMGSTTTPSGNVLTNPINSVVQLQNDFTQDIRYYYNVNNTNEWLVEYSTHVFPFAINYANSCPSHYGSGGGSVKDLVLSPEEKLDAEQDFYQSYTDFNNVEILFNNLKDGGNTVAMQTEIEMSWPDDMWELRAELLGNSPHLSKEVLMAAADKTEVLPESILFEILSANPDELRKVELISYLEDKNQPLPAYMIDILRQLANGMTYKTILLDQMSDYHHKKVNAAQDIIRSILNDSIIDKVELRNWLDNIGGYVADKQIISTYLADNDYSAAQNLLDILPALYDLEGNNLLAYNNYKSLVELQINLSQQERNIFGLTETELNVLVDIADNGYGTAKYSAQGILEYAYGYEYCNCPSLPDSIGLKSSNMINNDMIQAAGLDISAKPNPANSWVAFTYRLPATISSATIIIADAAGKVMDKINVNKEQGQKIWDVRDIEPGIYIYSLKAGSITKRGKLIIQ